MTFQHFPYTNAWGRKFDLAVKRSKVNLWSSFEQTIQILSPRRCIPRYQAFLVLEKKALSVSLCMGMAAILINGPWPFEHIFNPPLTKGFTWNSKKIGSRVSEKKSFKGVNRRRTASDHTSSSWAFGSGELKRHTISFIRFRFSFHFTFLHFAVVKRSHSHFYWDR